MSDQDKLELVEYRIRDVERFVVTRYMQRQDGSAESAEIGTFSSADTAYEVGYAMAKQHHNDLGWPVADDRMQYPQMPKGFSNPGPGAIAD